MPWTGLWTGLKTFGNEEFCGLLNSLQVAREREEPGACGLKIAHDCNDLYACNTSGWSCDYVCKGRSLDLPVLCDSVLVIAP